jgi:hypothetical protein
MFFVPVWIKRCGHADLACRKVRAARLNRL